tara:strand:- start:116 stop:691 length:576 start_codon:yes stop_codon:yes gene_type:complete
MIVLLSLPRTGSESYYNEHIAKPNPGWVHLHELSSWVVLDREPTLNLLTTNPKSSVKIFPWFECADHKKYIMTIIEHADEIIYNLREDFEAQCKSFMLSNLTQHWSNHRVKQEIDLDALDEVEYRGHSMKLLGELLEVENIYKQFPGKVILLESREQKPYNDPFIYKGSWPNIDDIVQQFEAYKASSLLFN